MTCGGDYTITICTTLVKVQLSYGKRRRALTKHCGIVYCVREECCSIALFNNIEDAQVYAIDCALAEHDTDFYVVPLDITHSVTGGVARWN